MEQIYRIFEEQFGYFPSPELGAVRAPARVNLIGEHIDYHRGKVMPIAISKYTFVLAVPSAKSRVSVFSALFGEKKEWDIKDGRIFEKSTWANYVKGVFVNLFRNGLVKSGFDMVILSDIPLGAGLSSSASLEAACAYAFLQSGNRKDISDFEIAKLCMASEHEFAGVKCGLMDQVASIFSRRNSVTVFDTRSGEMEFVPFFKDCLLAIIDSGVRRNLSDLRYNNRRQESETALKLVKECLGLKNNASFRDISADSLLDVDKTIDPILFKRAWHVVSEMKRVDDAFLALRSDGKKSFGELMRQSQESLRQNYEVSTPEIDSLCKIISLVPGVHGCRLTGAGFGGCVIALMEEEAEAEFKKRVPRENPVIFTKPSPGVLEL